ILPQITQVRPGEAELNRITGAQTPSGIPVVITAPVTERPARGTGSRSRRGRPSQSARRAPARRSVFDAAA
ncbi:ATP-dependent helicase, partial [Streptomyces sp. NPDC006309]